MLCLHWVFPFVFIFLLWSDLMVKRQKPRISLITWHLTCQMDCPRPPRPNLMTLRRKKKKNLLFIKLKAGQSDCHCCRWSHSVSAGGSPWGTTASFPRREAFSVVSLFFFFPLHVFQSQKPGWLQTRVQLPLVAFTPAFWKQQLLNFSRVMSEIHDFTSESFSLSIGHNVERYFGN